MEDQADLRPGLQLADLAGAPVAVDLHGALGGLGQPKHHGAGVRGAVGPQAGQHRPVEAVRRIAAARDQRLPDPRWQIGEADRLAWHGVRGGAQTASSGTARASSACHCSALAGQPRSPASAS